MAIGALVAACVMLAIGARLLWPPPSSGSVSVEGLGSTVRVTHDDAGVPHVQAEGVAEAFAGLGFAHAQDRLWQMELLRRTAQGTLSELFGRRTLPEDRFARTLGFADAAKREVTALDSQTAALLEAYSLGVNAWLAEIREGRVRAPLEFTWLEVVPRPWQPVDTLAIVRLRAWMLGRSIGSSLLLDRLVREVGGVASEPFFPESPTGARPNQLVRNRIGVDRLADRLASLVGLRGRVGSTGFVVGPDASKSGFPLLANDPHVGFQLPAVFYVAHVKAPGFEVGGATWPGVPAFWIGTTPTISWGQVALHVSASDLFEETIHPSDPHRYDVGGSWKPVERRLEWVNVRGAKPERVEVRATRHGALLASALPGDSAAQSLSLGWTGQGPESGIHAALALPQATSFATFRDSLRSLPGPPSIYLYADRGGVIGLQVAGQLPVRPIDTGLLPVPGSSRWYDWRGTLPFDELPHRTGTDRSWLVVGPRADGLEFPLPMAWLWTDTGATDRIRERLKSERTLGLHDLLQVQRETRNVRAPQRIRRMVDGLQPRSVEARRVLTILRDWDGGTGPDTVGASVYHAFRVRLLGRVLRRHVAPDHVDALLEFAEPVPGVLLERYLERVPREFELSMVHDSLEETWSWLASRVSANPARWVWGRVHRLRLPHSFARLGGGSTYLLGRLLSPGPIATPGDPSSIWTMHSDAGDPFHPLVGPAFRFAVDLGDPDHPRFGLCGGQSALPLARTYSDGVDDWVRGQPRVLWMHTADLAHHARGTWRLEPASD
jgi:penicillin amidase